jgi:hypothetical protein
VRFLTMLGIALALLLGPGAVAFLFVRYIGLLQSLAIRSLGLLVSLPKTPSGDSRLQANQNMIAK